MQPVTKRDFTSWDRFRDGFNKPGFRFDRTAPQSYNFDRSVKPIRRRCCVPLHRQPLLSKKKSSFSVRQRCARSFVTETEVPGLWSLCWIGPHIGNKVCPPLPCRARVLRTDQRRRLEATGKTSVSVTDDANSWSRRNTKSSFIKSTKRYFTKSTKHQVDEKLLYKVDEKNCFTKSTKKNKIRRQFCIQNTFRHFPTN
jgi:hypothetical protein